VPKLNQKFDDRIMLRCPHCGDSFNPQNAHLGVWNSGTYNCLKCGTSGLLSIGDRLDLGITFSKTVNTKKTIAFDEPDKELPFSHSKRPTKLPVTAVRIRDEWYDKFLMHNAQGKYLGYHLRKSGKDKRAYTILEADERKGILYPNAPKPLTSTREKPIIVVEGPYDVIAENCVSVLGWIGPKSVEHFYMDYVLLMPDGDVWADTTKTKSFLKTIRAYLKCSHVFFLGVLVLPKGLDVDELGQQKPNFVNHNQWRVMLSV
jgi:hypothetical protein